MDLCVKPINSRMEDLFWEMLEEIPESDDEEGLLKPPSNAREEANYNCQRLTYHKAKHQKQLQKLAARHARETQELRKNFYMGIDQNLTRQHSYTSPLNGMTFDKTFCNFLRNDPNSAKIDTFTSSSFFDVNEAISHLIENPLEDESYLNIDDLNGQYIKEHKMLRISQRSEFEYMRVHQMKEWLVIVNSLNRQPKFNVMYGANLPSAIDNSRSSICHQKMNNVSKPSPGSQLAPAPLVFNSNTSLDNDIPIQTLNSNLTPEQMGMITTLIQTIAGNNLLLR
ncbi:hypothetical protein G9A89_013293 [Geosiphon pyriformis]|nr:hypothetical protein G9A89_013293 [Geosiphon pyriformis]